ncbi:unnamed protein product [Ceratitis capitata]|uniref:(Mediterranean fruit fly) hypothetical protein n=1 Tax=Ceratitis capitata TaxID=7213 RepID=A0A811UY35_CERCA|nr:unnamed protein product [Ceratitis capitata]
MADERHDFIMFLLETARQPTPPAGELAKKKQSPCLKTSSPTDYTFATYNDR